MSIAISSLSSSSVWSSLFNKIDSSNQGYIDKSSLQSALEQVSSDTSSESVDAIFSQLDSDSDGKITKQELSDSMQKLSEALDAQYNQSRLGALPQEDEGFTQDELTSMIEEIGDTDSQRTSLMQSIVDNFDAADTNGDGKVTNVEAMAYDQSVNGTSSMAEAGAMPPPPPPSESTDTGFTQEELTSMLEEIGDTDSQRSALIQSIIDNFAAADTDGDGKVTGSEAMTYDQSVNGTDSTTQASAMPPPPPPSASSSSGDSTSYDPADTNQDGTVSLQELMAYQSENQITSQSDEMNVMKIMVQLMEAYGLSSNDSSQASASAAISAIA